MTLIKHIGVLNKNNIVDAVGEGIGSDIRDLGINGVERVRYVRLYAFHGAISEIELFKIATDLLTDPISQEHFKADEIRLPIKYGEWGIEVWFRNGVTDAVGETTLKGSRDLGVTSIESVDTGKGYILSGSIAKSQIHTICRRLLANDIIERYAFYEGENNIG